MKLDDIKEELGKHLSTKFRISAIIIDNLDMGLPQDKVNSAKVGLAELVREVERNYGRYLKVICIEQREAAETESQFKMLDLKNTLRKNSEDESDESHHDDDSDSEYKRKDEETKGD